MGKVYFFLILGISLGSYSSFSQGSKSAVKWKANPFDQHVFIENKGQFSKQEQKEAGGKIAYFTRKGAVNIYFTNNSITYRFDSIYRDKSTKDKEDDGDEKEAGLKIKHEFIQMQWEGANANPFIEVQEPATNYFTYSNPNDKTGKSGIKANAWKKLIYHNLYNGIDVEFFYPDKGGIEYTIIAKPGADISKFEMHYSGNTQIKLTSQNITITAPFTKLIDHAPGAFTDNDGKKESLSVAFKTLGNTISFDVGSYDRSKILTIDPWISAPDFVKGNKAYDLNIDSHGNIYVYGSRFPYMLDKFDSSGALLWSYTTSFVYIFLDTTNFSFYGGMCVDGHSGSTFIGEGCDPQYGAEVLKINTNGIQVATNSGNHNFTEIWKMAYNNCEQEGMMIGGGITGFSYQIAMLDTTLATLVPKQVLNTFHIDFSMLALDNYGNCYAFDDTNGIIKAPLPSFAPVLFNVPSGYSFYELSQPTYIPGYLGSTGGNGYNGLAASLNFLYSFDGSVLNKWNFTTGANLGSIKIYKTPAIAGGLTVGTCDDIFLGVLDSAYRYDVNLHKTNSYLLPDSVYDMKLGASNNMLYACGKGFLCAVSTPPPVTITYTVPSSCIRCNGRATANVNCGVAPYTFLWNNGDTNQTDTGLCAGVYSVKVTDGACPPLNYTARTIINSKLGYTASVKDTNPGCILRKGNVTAYPVGGVSPYTYNWSNGSTNQKDTGLAAGSYTCTITDDAGCKAFVVATLVNPSPPVISIVPREDSMCIGGNLALKASGGSTYSWSPNTGLSCYNCPSPIANPSVTTTYTVIGTDTNGCTGSEITTIKVLTTPKPVISGKDSVCTGYADTLIVTGGTRYLWSNSGTTSTITVVPQATETISVNVSNGLCSHDTSFVIHTIVPNVKVAITKDSVCPGDADTLTASGGLSYRWNNQSTSNSIIVNPVAPTTYTLYAETKNCPDSITVTIGTIKEINLSLHGKDSICPGDSTTLNAIATGAPARAYIWNTGATTSSISVSPAVTTTYTSTVVGKCNSAPKTITVTVVPLPKPIITGDTQRCLNSQDTLVISGGSTYIWTGGQKGSIYITGKMKADSTIYVIVENSLGCAVKDSFSITVEPFPADSIIPPKVACEGSYVVIKAIGKGAGPFSYLWSPGGQTSDSITVKDTNSKYIISISNGCVISKSIPVMPDNPLLVACCNTVIYAGDDTIIVAHGTGILKYKWKDSSAVICLNLPCDSIKVNPKVTTTYTVIGTDTLGCEIEQIVTIIVEEPCNNLLVPNVFTPDYAGPYGTDNLFYIKTEDITTWSLVIYDRWGKEMYKSTNPAQYWDGITESGGKAPDGVYYYIINTTCQGNNYKRDGFVQLIR